MTALRGIEAEIRRLEQLEKQVKAALRKGELRAAKQIAEAAKAKAPGSLSSNIYVEQNTETTTIHGGGDLAAYNEFGTGTSETVKNGVSAADYLAGQPKEVQDEARKFYVNGRGQIPARPFFFPAIIAGKESIFVAVEEELNKLSK